MKQWYELLFENYGESYDRETFSHGTQGECDFIEQELNYNKNVRILDIGCGTGRHSIELSKRGYCVTGIDLSQNLLDKAIEKAGIAGVAVDFQRHDARCLPFEKEFDFVMMICEGAFPLMETDEMNFQILQNATKALKTGGKIMFTTLNGLFPLHHSICDFTNSNSDEGNAHYRESSFDMMTFRDYNITTFVDDAGIEHELHCNERYYVPPEITWMLQSLGLSKVEIFGAKLGAFSRNDALTIDDFEMLVIAQ